MESKVLSKELSYATEQEKVAFYKKTYAHVAGGILLFIVFEYFLLNSETVVSFMMSMLDGIKWLLLLGGFMFITHYAESTAMRTSDKKMQYLAYVVYIFAESIIFVPLLYVAVFYVDSTDLIKQAAIVTLMLFTGLSSVVLITKKDFSFLRTALTIGGFIAIGLIIAGSIFGFNMGLWFSVGMCVLAGGSILYQTSNLVHKFSTEDYIPAAIGLFASLMLLFWYILRIFLRRR